MTAPTLAQFHGVPVSIVHHADKKWLTAHQIGLCLGYAETNARIGISNLYNRHSDEFSDEDTFVINLITNSVHGDKSEKRGNPNTRLFSLAGCNLLGFFSNTSRAKEFRAWAKQALADAVTLTPPPHRFGRSRQGLSLTRAVELQACQLFVAGHSMAAIARHLGISTGAVSLMLHGRYRFSPDAGVDLTTPELLNAVIRRHMDYERERLTKKYRASAANQELAIGLDQALPNLLVRG